jgi:UDP-glucose 4-epimerase
VGEIFNLGSTEEITIEDLAKKIIAATESSSSIRHMQYEEAYGPGFEDMERRIPDIAKARSWFGFAPKHSLDDIIGDVANDMRGRLMREAKRATHAG